MADPPKKYKLIGQASPTAALEPPPQPTSKYRLVSPGVPQTTESGGVAPLDRNDPLGQQWRSQYPNMMAEIKGGWHDIQQGLDDAVSKSFWDRNISAFEVLAGGARVLSAPVTAEIKTWLGDPVERTTGLPGISEGINLAAQLVGPAVPAKVFDTLDMFRDNKIAEEVVKAFSPTSRGVLATRGERGLRALSSQVAHDTVTADAQLSKYEGILGRLSEDAQLDFIHRWETGAGQLTPRLQEANDAITGLLDGRWQRTHDLGPGHLDNYIEHYAPHDWEDPERAATLNRDITQQKLGELQAASKRPLKGDQSFRKQRIHMTVKEGMAHGLRLKDTNPLRMAAKRIRSMDQYYYAQRFIDDFKADGLLQYARNASDVPFGYARIKDPAFQVFVRNDPQVIAEMKQASREAGVDVSGAPVPGAFAKLGEWYAPEPIARLINNFLSEGINFNEGAGFLLGQALRYTGNMLSLTQLGWSGFHLMFTTNDAFFSRLGHGFQQLIRADPRGLWTVATSPLGALRNLYTGSRLRQAYRSPLGVAPNSKMYRLLDALIMGRDRTKMGQIVDMFVKGGARIQMDAIHQVLEGQPVWRQIMRGTFFTDIAKEFPRSPFKTAFHAASQLLKLAFEPINEPIMGWWVPRQKMGVFYDMAADFIRRNPTASYTERDLAAIRMWDSVDNRMGQMVYDNLFWSKMAKDIAFLAVRAVGWTLGTFRELGGAVFDAYGNLRHLAHGEAHKLEFTPRMAYAAAMTAGTALEGAIMTYLWTGHGPTELKDYFFPPTGKLTKTGAKERVSIPGYLKDVVAFNQNPARTAVNKTNPTFALITSWYYNEDFYGTAIVDPADPLPKRLWDIARYVERNATPFSLQSIQRLEQSGTPTPSAWLSSVFGFQAAPGYIVDPEAAAAAERRREGPALRKKALQDAETPAAPAEAPQKKYRLVSP